MRASGLKVGKYERNRADLYLTNFMSSPRRELRAGSVSPFWKVRAGSEWPIIGRKADDRARRHSRRSTAQNDALKPAFR